MRRGAKTVKSMADVFALHGGVGFGYSPRLAFRRRSSVVERILGKAEVVSSILPGGTIDPRSHQGPGVDLIPIILILKTGCEAPSRIRSQPLD